MKTISTQEFKDTLSDIHKNTENRKFCFVIGAGASFKSGIPTGGELADRWFKEIKKRLPGNDFEKWFNDSKINTDDLAASYGDIYRKRFEIDKTSGYEFLVQAMKTAKPSFGHIVLAQILSRIPGHCVLTTNFDSLIESSVYQFTNKTPLVCGHESLSGYARPSKIHPLVIKVHRDLLLSPKSDPEEIKKLATAWNEPLNHIFSTHIPIVIGYGGNDGSLMSYFNEMNKPSNFFWCGLSEKHLSKDIKGIIEKHDGSFVLIDGFDELMHELLIVFDEIKPIKEELNEITSERIKSATGQLEEIAESKATKVPAPKRGVKKKPKTQELSALEYSNMADNEPNFEKRKTIFLEALEKYPTTGWLWWNFTYFLHFEKKDYKKLNEYYNKALQSSDEIDAIFGNYALYLKDIKKDYNKADEYFLKALAIDPDEPIWAFNYALFLDEVKKKYEQAKVYYEKALQIHPKNPNYNYSYAGFLFLKKKDIVGAENYYLKAMEIDPQNVYYKMAYATFLLHNKKKLDVAEEHFIKYIEEYPDNPSGNGNYAQLLLYRGQKEKAANYINYALNNIKNDPELELELWFYKYAHFPEHLKEAEKNIETLLSKGIKSINWDFDVNIEQALKDKHPNPKKLKEIAKRITTEGD